MTTYVPSAHRASPRVLLSVLALSLLAGACGSSTSSRAPSPDAWAVVNGREVTREQVEVAYRRNAQASPAPSDEEAVTAKLGILNELIIQDLIIAKAAELKIEVPATELDAAYAEGRKNVPDEAFNQEMAKRNLTPADIREGLRRDLLVQKVLEREVMSKITVTDQEITDFFTANRAQFNRPEDAYHIAQIAVTPDREPEITNRTGDDAVTAQEAEAKAQMIMERLKSGSNFADLAADFSEDPQTAPRGGDLGFVPLSALKQAPPALRDAVLKSEPGTVRLVSQGGAHTIVLFIAHDTAGQKDPSMAPVRDAITTALRGRREQLLRTAYLAALRNDAVVVNYLAKRVLETPGKVPTLTPAPPAAQ